MSTIEAFFSTKLSNQVATMMHRIVIAATNIASTMA